MTTGTEPTLGATGAEASTGAADIAAVLRGHWTRARDATREQLDTPERRRRATLAAVAVLVVLGLLLPPVALPSRIASIGYDTVRADGALAVQSNPPGALLRFSAQNVPRPAKVRLALAQGLPRGVDALPQGHQLMGPPYELAFKGPVPKHASLLTSLPLTAPELPYVDPYGWDGARWRWLPVSFVGANQGQAQVELTLDQFVPSVVVLTRASAGSTQVSAVLLPPPSVVPAAVAELPVLEMAAYHLGDEDGSLSGGVFPVPARPTGRYAIVDNLERDSRIRSDLVNNMLSLPESRQRNREAIVGAARRDDLSGVVLDYRGIGGDLAPTYVDFVNRLADDLHKHGVELIIAVPMPRAQSDGWDPGPLDWRPLGAAADGLRVMLPSDAPLEIDRLDSMVRWALGHVERQKLQLGVPVQGRDLTAGRSAPIGFGTALKRVLDMARSDAPRRISPGEESVVELPSLREAQLARDPAFGMWRFDYWDDYRAQHTVWLNDALGLEPAFQIAARYRLGKIALEGVEAGLDPSLWHMVRTFQRNGTTEAALTDYQLSWQLVGPNGTAVRESVQALDDPVFRFRAPEEEGTYQLAVSLVTGAGEPVVPGDAVTIQVAPAPPPSPTPTAQTVIFEPTPRPISPTMPAPPDENESRKPILATDVLAKPVNSTDFGAKLNRSTVLRSAPDAYSDKLGDARIGDRFDVLGKSPDGRWFRVRLQGTGLEGWIRDAFLDLAVDADTVPVAVDATPTP